MLVPLSALPADNMSGARVIKRYANRKMYDTELSCYVTLEEVAAMVRAGQDVQVIDNKTKRDLTEVTLTQALLDSERRNRGSVPLTGLRTLIEQGNEFLHKRFAEPVQRVRTDAERTVTAWKDEAERTVTAWKSEAERRAERVLHRKGAGEDEAEESTAASESEAAPKRTPAASQTFVGQTQKAVDDLQQRLDEGIRHAVAALGLPVREQQELADLRRRVEALEARLAELEAPRNPPDAAT
jgi:polyhydroxyalkanoate synthesis repressor PhaR